MVALSLTDPLDWLYIVAFVTLTVWLVLSVLIAAGWRSALHTRGQRIVVMLLLPGTAINWTLLLLRLIAGPGPLPGLR